MKNKIPYILLVVAIIIGAAIIIKGVNDKKSAQTENTNYAQSIKDSGSTEKVTESIYEYYQTDPESGLAVIYTFRISPEKDGKRSGSITIDGSGKNVNINCAVKSENYTETFLFSYYGENSDSLGEFNIGDELVRLHKKERDTVVEFIKLSKVYPGSEMVRNY